jgi:hypothetical protein
VEVFSPTDAASIGCTPATTTPAVTAKSFCEDASMVNNKESCEQVRGCRLWYHHTGLCTAY